MFLTLLALALVAAPARAQQPGPFEEDLLPAPEDPFPGRPFYEQPQTPCSSSRLWGGELLPPAPGLYRRWNLERAYARPEMVEVLTAAAEALSWELPEADPLPVGAISRRGGGPLPGHASHRTGLDADIGLYRAGGRTHAYGLGDIPVAELDVEAMWIVIREMLATGLVERILYDRTQIRLIKEHVVETGALTQEEADAILLDLVPTDVWTRDGVVQHHRGHRDHLHVRVRCDAVLPDEGDTGGP